MHRGEREVNYSGSGKEREREEETEGDIPLRRWKPPPGRTRAPISPCPASQEWSFPRRLPASQRTRVGEWKSSVSLTQLLCKEQSRGEHHLTFPGRL